jgi:hypothetical protein
MKLRVGQIVGDQELTHRFTGIPRHASPAGAWPKCCSCGRESPLSPRRVPSGGLFRPPGLGECRMGEQSLDAAERGKEKTVDRSLIHVLKGGSPHS